MQAQVQVLAQAQIQIQIQSVDSYYSDDYIYLYDYGPGNGMRWVFGPFLGAENAQIRFGSRIRAYLGYLHVWPHGKASAIRS